MTAADRGRAARALPLSLAAAALAALWLGCGPQACLPPPPAAPRSPGVAEPPRGAAEPWRGPATPEPAERGNRAERDFSGAKRLLYNIHEREGHELTFYCGCRYRERRPVWGSCGYAPQKRSTRAKRTEVEHVVPASRFGSRLAAWAEGDPSCVRKKSNKPYRGRDCARRADARFERVEADMHNLRPVIGELNAERSAYPAGEVPGEPREFGACDAELGRGRFEPPEAVQGDVARIHFYMAWAYPDLVELSDEERQTLARWAGRRTRPTPGSGAGPRS